MSPWFEIDLTLTADQRVEQWVALKAPSMWLYGRCRVERNAASAAGIEHSHRDKSGTVMVINQSGQLTTRGPSRTDIRQEPKEEKEGNAKDPNKAPPKPCDPSPRAWLAPFRSLPAIRQGLAHPIPI